YIHSLHPHAPPRLTPLSLHDALPISLALEPLGDGAELAGELRLVRRAGARAGQDQRAHALRVREREVERDAAAHREAAEERPPRSEEHTSELQSRFDLVCRLLLEKKK